MTNQQTHLGITGGIRTLVARVTGGRAWVGTILAFMGTRLFACFVLFKTLSLVTSLNAIVHSTWEWFTTWHTTGDVL